MERIQIQLPLTKETASSLKAGDFCYLSGPMYVARDAAHARLFECLKNGEPLPVSLEGETVYYMGPSPAKEGQVIGSAGPTTSSRMDRYTPALIREGMLGMVGKGRRSSEVKEAMTECGAVYFAAIGGAGALLSKCIKSAEIKAYEDLGAEALRLITVEKFPVVVAIDSHGNDVYNQVRG